MHIVWRFVHIECANMYLKSEIKLYRSLRYEKKRSSSLKKLKYTQANSKYFFSGLVVTMLYNLVLL